MSEQDAVLLERRHGHVALVTLNRPQARNAINGAVATRLDAIVEETESDDSIWVVVLAAAGAGEVFCAGADLKEIAAGRSASLGTQRSGFAGFVKAPRAKPWIAAVQGIAVGGGFELCLACDMIVASANAEFGLPEVQRGLMALAGGMYRLPRTIPRMVANEMLATGERIDASRAYQLGLVNRVAAHEQTRDAALELAAKIARNAPVAVRESLGVARRGWDSTDDELYQYGRERLRVLAATEDFKEGPRAFLEKRAPRWSGR